MTQSLAQDLDARLAQAQARWRAVGAVAAVARHGSLVWSGAAGRVSASDGAVPDADTQFRIGSITKTFTAVLVMQCRDDGLLELETPLASLLPGTAHGRLCVRHLLSHLSGLQREPVGEIWERPEGPPVSEMLAGLEHAEAVLPPGRRWHYSNLAFALLGEAVARLRGGTWEEVLEEHLLSPLGLKRTTPRRVSPFAAGYFTHPYADAVTEEPEFPGQAFAPAGELWSTAADLVRWGAFLAEPHVLDPDGALLSAETVDEMCHPQVMYDLDAWSLAWGLGLMLHRRGDRILLGHDGAMPGFLAGLAARRKEGVAAVCFASTTAGADPGGLAVDLALAAIDAEPSVPDPWRPGEPPGDDVTPLLGLWWSEGSPFTFFWSEGRFQARRNDAPPEREPAVFERESPDRWRTVSGREQGEMLRVERDLSGAVHRMLWATYPFTRDARSFSDNLAP